METALEELVRQLRETEEFRNYRDRFEDIKNDRDALDCV